MQVLEIYQMDTSRLDVIQEVAKTYYNLEDYTSAWLYYNKLLDIREEKKLNVYIHENIKMAWVCKQLAYDNKEAQLLEDYKQFSENDQSIYQPLLEASYYFYINDSSQALDYLEEFSNAENYHYWILLLADEPHIKQFNSWALSLNVCFIHVLKYLLHTQLSTVTYTKYSCKRKTHRNPCLHDKAGCGTGTADKITATHIEFWNRERKYTMIFRRHYTNAIWPDQTSIDAVHCVNNLLFNDSSFLTFFAESGR